MLPDFLYFVTYSAELRHWHWSGVMIAPGGCFTNVSRVPQNILAKIHNTRNYIYGENFNLKICTGAQSRALGTRTKFQLEILNTSTIYAIHKFRNNFLESSRNVSETTPRATEVTLKENMDKQITWIYYELIIQSQQNEAQQHRGHIYRTYIMIRFNYHVYQTSPIIYCVCYNPHFQFTVNWV